MSQTFRSLIGSALASAVACAVYAADVIKGDNTTPLNQTGSGAVPAWRNALTYS